MNIRDFGTLVGLLLIAGVFAAMAPGFLERAQSHQHPAAIEHQRLRRARDDAGHHLGRHRSVGRTDRGARRRAVGRHDGRTAFPFPIAVLAGLGLGAVCGAVNGALVSFGGLQPFIVTLGTLSTYRALALIFTGGNPILGVPAASDRIANGSFFGVPASVLVVIVVAIIAGMLLRKTPFGEYLLAVGGNEEAAHIAGVPIALTKIGAYMLSGVPGGARGAHPDRSARRRRTHPRQPLGARRDRRGGDRRSLADGRQGQHHRHAARRHHPRRHEERPDAPECSGLLPAPCDRPDHPLRHADRSRHSGSVMSALERREATGSDASAVVVVGSLHYDIMVDASDRPRKGETVTGRSWSPKFGGKGGNQAAAAQSQGVPTAMVGAVGNDDFGPRCWPGSIERGVDRSAVATLEGVGSGMSVAIFDDEGDYGAVIVSGSNLVRRRRAKPPTSCFDPRKSSSSRTRSRK